MTLPRCAWVTADPVYIAYHDAEWGWPLYDPHQLFEFLLLEGMQAGLSWITVLKKRPALRAAFADFDAECLASFTDADLQACLTNPQIIRNRLKVYAARNNAQAYCRLVDAGLDFSALLWDFVGQQPRVNHWPVAGAVPSQTSQSEAMSCYLKKQGFRFVGPTICYAFMQAVGMVMDHTMDCFLYAELADSSR